MNAPAKSYAPGTVIGERWELIAPIGAGAMGDVWRARHLALGHEVAIKLMKPVASGNRELVQRFTREARIAAQLRHRHIARVEDFGATPEGAPWLVMELLRGDSLEELLERHQRLDRETVITVARHVGAACDVAHAAGIVHRDLKPANCFLVREEDGTTQVKVLDFGVAKAADGQKLTAVGVQLLGTPVYMSPEQTQSPSEIDGRSDLWSLAVMLFELLTGQLPFDADSLPALLVAIGSAPVPSMRSIDAALPAALDAWAARALDRDRDRRFQTGRELADAFAAALSAPLTETRASAPPQPAHHSQLGVAPTMPAMPSVPFAPMTQAPPSAASSTYATATPSMPSPHGAAYPQHAVIAASTFASAAQQGTYAQPAQQWQAPYYAAPVATRARTNTPVIVAVAVLLTALVMAGAWAFTARSGSAPQIAPTAPPVVITAVPQSPSAVNPTPTSPVALAPTTPVAPTRPPVATRPMLRAPPVVRPRLRPPPPNVVLPSEPQTQRPVPVFGTSGQRPYNPDEP